MEFVDLDLPSGLQWASCNVGATKPQESGLFFAWGETEGYDKPQTFKKFTWNDYKHCNGSEVFLTKYCNYYSFNPKGLNDCLYKLELIDDAAYQMDNNCRMPTKDEFAELFSNTLISFIKNYDETNVNGVKFISKQDNSKSIFIPSSGFISQGLLMRENFIANVWSSSLSLKTPNDAYCMMAYPYCVDSEYLSARSIGKPIRAVMDGK